MRKNLMKFFLSFFVMAIVAACSDVENPTIIENDAVKVVTTFDKDDVVPAEGETLKLEIKTKLDWSISSNQEWCIINKTSGSGDAEISLTVKPNTSSTAREVTVKINCGEVSQTIAINQAKGDAPVVDEDDLVANDFKLDDSTPIVSFSNDFNDVTNDKDYAGSRATNAAKRGDRVWRGAVHKADKYIKATAHKGKVGQTYESWFITPAFTVDALKDGNVYFDCAVAFYKPTSSLKVFFLELVNGKILPTELSVNIPTEGMYQWTKNIAINLSQFSGKTGFIGFQYIGEGGDKNSATYCLDNIRFTDNSGQDQNGGDDDDNDNNQGGEHGSDSPINAAAIELPQLRKGPNDMFVSHSTNFKGEKVTTYSFEYDCSKKHSLWMAYRIDDRTSESNVKRRDAFRPDPQIPTQYQRGKNDFGRKGYSRGHLVASSDRLYSREANSQTFYYTNMTPQIQNGFNGGIWLNLERKLQSWGKSNSFRDTIYVVKGGTIDSEEHILKYIDGDRSKPVPKYNFMAILCRKNDQFKAVAYWFEHRVYGKNDSFNNYAISIDELEEKTGFDFFHNLPDNLENEVEREYNVNLWN